jgi:uncharacterized membrane protein
MLRLNGIRTGFLLGVSLLLAAMIYFFAANWTGLDRLEKVAVAAGFVFLFYGVSFALTKFRAIPDHHAFLSDVLLVGGCIAFGAAVALLGQIYNSHADSYRVFFIWSIPAFLFAWITRYNPFYVLSYALLHLTIWLYFFPSSSAVVYTNEQTILIGWMFALINLALFVLTEANPLRSAPLKFLSFVLFYLSLLLLTNSFRFETAGVWMNIPCAAAIAIGFYYFIRVRLNKAYLTLQALAASAFAVYKFIELAVRHASTAFYFFGLVFVAILLTGNVLFFRYLNKLNAPAEVLHPEPSGHRSSDRGSDLVSKAVSTIVTVLGVIIGSISSIGLVVLTSGTNDPKYTLYVLSFLFVLPMIGLPRVNPVVRYTVLTIGYIMGMISVVWINRLGLSALFLIPSITGWLRLEGRIQRLFTYALLNFNIAIVLAQLLDKLEHRFAFVILLLAILNAVLYASHLLLPEGPLRRHVRENGLFFTLLFLFWLTFFGDIFPYSYEIFNFINFAVVTLLVFGFLRRKQAVDAAISLVFWFVFVAFKYYDTLWTLLHKSITLALSEIIILTVTSIIAHRTKVVDDNGDSGPFMSKKLMLIALVILLQFGFLGYQTVRCERLLATGTSVKMEFQPLDPGSLLHGD